MLYNKSYTEEVDNRFVLGDLVQPSCANISIICLVFLIGNQHHLTAHFQHCIGLQNKFYYIIGLMQILGEYLPLCNQPIWDVKDHVADMD